MSSAHKESSLKKSFQSVSKSTIKSSNLNSSTSSLDNLSQICSVCAENEPKFWSVSRCGHKICWICSLRLRALYGSKACPICKSQSEFVFICKRREEAEEFFKKNPKEFNVNSSLSIAFDNEVTRSACESLLQFQCPFNHNHNNNNSKDVGNTKTTAASKPCNKHFKTKQELRKHVINAHELQMCEICLEHKKCFSVELALYNRTSLQKHQRDANHPRCQVCDRIFYSEDELAEHCRDEHELCHICQRSGRLNRYFQNYSRLEEHFGKEHFLCPEPLCRELKFVVFENELEYKAHQAEVHLAHQKLQRSQQRQLQRLNISFNSESSPTAANTQIPASSPKPTLTIDQRNQIGANLVYGQVTDDLANRLQSLSLYQSRNDEFIESLRGTFHLNQNQIQSIFQASRAFQRDECSATEFLLKIEKIVGNSNNNQMMARIANGLSDLQLDEMKRQRLNVAIKGYLEKCSEFPELKTTTTTTAGASNKKLTWTGRLTSTSNFDEDEKGSDPFAFARPPGFSSTKNSSNTNNIGMKNKPFANSSVKVLQITKSSSPSGNPIPKTADPSRNPNLLLSQLAGGPALKNSSRRKSSAPVKMTSFSSAALGNVTVQSSGSRNVITKPLDEEEYPSLNSNQVVNNTFNTPIITSGNAFSAPSDRDQLESFTIGNEAEEGGGSEQSTSNSTGAGKKEKKSKKVVFRYGQKWDV